MDVDGLFVYICHADVVARQLHGNVTRREYCSLPEYVSTSYSQHL